MKHFQLSILYTLCFINLFVQPYIHSYNDYQQESPLTNALKNKAFVIEEDVYLTVRGLVLANDKKDTATAVSLKAFATTGC